MTRITVKALAALLLIPASASLGQTVICAGSSRTFVISNPVFPYEIDGQSMPILQLVAGNSYTFDCSAVPQFHPVFFTPDQFGGFSAASIASGSVNGYTVADSCGACNRTSFTITPNASGLMSFYYQCHIHSGLGNQVQIITRPTIDVHPQPLIVDINGGGVLSVTASSADHGAITYQWRKGGVNINGATSATLTLSNAQASTAGSYDCVVSRACATTTSNAATVTVRCGIADVARIGGAFGPDGLLTVDDIVAYLSAFFATNTSVADLTNLGGGGGPDGQITVDDLVIFLARFFAGC